MYNELSHYFLVLGISVVLTYNKRHLAVSFYFFFFLPFPLMVFCFAIFLQTLLITMYIPTQMLIAEAQILEAIGVDYIDESKVRTPAVDAHHINKHNYRIPFVCGCCNLGEALMCIADGAAMIQTKGEAGTGNVVEALRHNRSVLGEIRRLESLDDDEVFTFAKEIAAPHELTRQTKQLGV
jgi:hypothetical protein